MERAGRGAGGSWYASGCPAQPRANDVSDRSPGDCRGAAMDMLETCLWVIGLLRRLAPRLRVSIAVNYKRCSWGLASRRAETMLETDFCGTSPPEIRRRPWPSGDPDLGAWPTGSREFVTKLVLGRLAEFERCMGPGEQDANPAAQVRKKSWRIRARRGGLIPPSPLAQTRLGVAEEDARGPGIWKGCRTTPKRKVSSQPENPVERGFEPVSSFRPFLVSVLPPDSVDSCRSMCPDLASISVVSAASRGMFWPCPLDCGNWTVETGVRTS